MSDKVNIEVNNNNLQDIRVDFFPFLSKDQSSQTYTFNFQPDSAKYNAQTVAAGGKIAGIGGPSGTKVFKAISSSPYQQQVGTGDSVAEGDIVTVELDSVPTSKVTVEIVVSYSDVSVSKTLPSNSWGGNYIYIPSEPDNKLYIFDTQQGNFVGNADITTAVSNLSRVFPAYRYATKQVYVAWSTGAQVIDVDPNSADFSNVIQTISFTSSVFEDKFYFDNNKDKLIAIGSTVSEINPDTGDVITLYKVEQVDKHVTVLNIPHIYYNPTRGANMVYYPNTGFQSPGFSANVLNLVYNRNNSLIYASQETNYSITVVSIGLFPQQIANIGTINDGRLLYSHHPAIDQVNNIYVACSGYLSTPPTGSRGGFVFVDCNTNTVRNTYYNDHVYLGAVWSAVTGYVYALSDSYNNELHVIDLSIASGNPVIQTIPVNSASTGARNLSNLITDSF